LIKEIGRRKHVVKENYDNNDDQLKRKYQICLEYGYCITVAYLRTNMCVQSEVRKITHRLKRAKRESQYEQALKI
jgi:hypothetical protein